MPPTTSLGSCVGDGSLKSRSPRICCNCSTASFVTSCFSTPHFKTMGITTERPSSYARCGRETFQPRSRSRTILDLPKSSSELNSHQIGETPSRAHVSASTPNLWLANCYFAHDSLGFPVLLPFFDGQSGRSFYPLDRHHGPVARTGWGPFRGCGVPSPQAPTPLHKLVDKFSGINKSVWTSLWHQ
jgi:hypothetical protein